jgi:branched-chain amino acid transport system substrate-binding protein
MTLTTGLPGAAALVLIACIGQGGSAPTSYAGKTIALGAVLSVTGAGVNYGPQQKKGIDLAVETVNRAGVNGGRISVHVQDDTSDPRLATTETETLVNTKHVLGLIGPTLTIAATPVHTVAQAKQTPVLATSEIGKHVVGDCAAAAGCGYIFRDSLGEAVAIPANVKAAANKSHPRTGLILYAGDYTPSVEARDTFRQAFADNGITVASGGLLAFSKHDTDFRAMVTSAKDLKAGIWAISALGDRPGTIVAEARAQGYTGPIIGDDSFNTYTASQAAGKAGVGAQAGSGYWLGNGDAANQSFVHAYKVKYRDSKGTPELPDEVAAQAYSAVLLFAEAARNANLSFTDVAKDRAALRSALERVSLATPLGQFGFTGAHDAQQPIWINAIDGKGGFVNVTSIPAG